MSVQVIFNEDKGQSVFLGGLGELPSALSYLYLDLEKKKRLLELQFKNKNYIILYAKKN